MGAALGELHTALSHYAAEAQPGLPPFGALAAEPRAPVEALGGWPTTADAREALAWWSQERMAVTAWVGEAYGSLPQQVIHRDVDPSNTLVAEGRVSGSLDFEYAGVDARALDVAAALKYTVRAWENHEPWETARSFCRGYRGWQALSDAEASAIPWLTRLRELAAMELRAGRARTDDEAAPLLGRLQAMRASAEWLERHGEHLVEIAAG